ncbi:hypothetical protein HSTV2_77 [Halorubrum sodomense tailed virus 2]|uniref:Uncharacterized protein n=1 Tax=Halorubrum sodomense tailed virus 2 TaxID=1262527 RepID=L7TGN8_9CAUD|nr:hypothetical protein HSTV2_77 [Halorubrum sodomense tailed virus 2]AGC34344.1 hypothetical protein HSTV2_77 [Halorubrum sodomense tailed virus 2]
MSKSERDLTEELGPSPNPFFAKKGEPWKDAKLMVKLNEKHKYQYEIAHVLGCSESQVSYWMNKALEEYQPEPSAEELECEYFEVCGNETPGPNNGLCDTCLSIARHNAAAEEPIDASDSDTMLEHMSELYAAYDEDEVVW